jgi:hypothetical protein
VRFFFGDEQPAASSSAAQKTVRFIGSSIFRCKVPLLAPSGKGRRVG